jgi:hypothetical protein
MTIFRVKCGSTLNVVVQWLTHLVRIREVPGSNLGPETGYNDLSFSWFSVVVPGKFLCNTLNGARRHSSTAFTIYHSLITLSFDAM